MVKIFFVANTSFYIHNFRSGLMQALKAQAREVIAAAPPDEYTQDIMKRFRFIPLKNLDRKGMNPLKDILFFRELYQIYRREKPDVILHFTIKPNIYGSLAAQLTNCQTLNTITGGGYTFSRKGLLPALVNNLYKYAFRFSKRVIFQNDEDREFFIQSGLVQRHKTGLIRGSGVDTRHFNPDSGLGASHKQKFTFLLISRMLWDKGIGEYVQAAENIKRQQDNIEFCLLGPIDQGSPEAVPKDMIESWERESGMEYLGTTKDVRPFIAQSQVIVLPSYYREGIPKALLEAMAMTKPIITTDSIGCREVIEDGKNGFMVPVKDPEALAAAMMKMIDIGEEDRREMGRYGREKAVREFDKNIVIQAYVEEINKILGNKRII